MRDKPSDHGPNVPTPRTVGAYTLIPLLVFAGTLMLIFWGVTQWEAARLGYQPELGPWWFHLGSVRVYPPWMFLPWGIWFWRYAPAILGRGYTVATLGAVIAGVALVARAVWVSRAARLATTHGSAIWGRPEEERSAGLRAAEGVILGLSQDGTYLRDNGPAHVAVVEPTGAGKGVGIVIPTLLTWPGSVLVHDIKGENWELTAGYRAGFTHPIYFNPTDPMRSAHWNPLFEVRSDENQIRDIQNIADQVVDPLGKGKESHWDKTADQFLLGVILHVLHAEPDKSLYGIGKFLSDPSRTIEQTLNRMKSVKHKNHMAHQRIASAAQAMLNKSEEERSGVLSTALACLGVYADPIIARNTQDSDFTIEDLTNGKYPMSLYLIVPDSDRLRLKPLTRLMITMITQRLVEDMAPKKHRLLILIDEFARLGRMHFLADAVSFVRGYGIKVMLIVQSMMQVEDPEAYGKGSNPINDCKIKVVAAPQDTRTAEWISEQLGQKTEVHQQTTYTGHRLAPWLGHVMVANQESARALLDPAEVMKLPATHQVVLSAQYPPFYTKKLRYYEVPALAERAKIPPPTLRMERPYPYRPAPRRNPWTVTLELVETVTPVAAAPANVPSQGRTIPAAPPVAQPVADDPPDVRKTEKTSADVGSEEEAARRRALDDQESEHRRRHHKRFPRV